jgi:Carboxypeptidase regulatory-like domain
MTIRRAIIALVLASASLPVSAQVTGRISGFVKDPAGAAIPSVAVTARMTEQQSTGTARTNAEGFYDILALPPGDYEISFEAAGFRRQVRSGVELTIGQNLRVDASLEVGSLETQVTVTGTAPLVDTISPVLSGLIDDRRVVDLPLNGRNVMSLAGILPGVLAVAVPQQMDNARSGPIMDVNGGRSNMNLFTFNGGYFNNPSRNTGIDYPPPDAIEEVRILTHDFSAEYGHNPGSQVLVASKTGTNQLHGAAWEFLRNNDLNARNFFAPTVPVVHQDQFGASAGGPIRKDKLFIFGVYQGLINHQQAQSVQSLLPSAAQRGGDFTALKNTLVDPSDPLTSKPLLDPLSGAPCVAGNKIAPGCISPAATKVLAFVPVTPSNILVTLAASPIRGDMGMTRADWNQSSRHRVFGSYFADRNSHSSPLAGSSTLANYMSESFAESTDVVVVNDVYTISPTLLNLATVSWNRTNSSQAENKTVNPSDYGINLPIYPQSGSLTLNVNGNFILGSGTPTSFFSTNWQAKDSLSWTRGKHQMKFGYELLHLQFEQQFLGAPNFVFTGDATGNPIADFLLGSFNSGTVGFGVRDTNVYTSFHAVFFQDEFKVHPRVTLTYGLRYEPFLPWKDSNNRINAVRPGQQSTVVPDAPPGIVYPGDAGITKGLDPADLNNFGPRLGFAWDVFGNGRTSVRGGYGMFFESVNADSLAQQNPPYGGQSNIFGGLLDNPYGSLGLTAPPTQTTGSFGCVKIAAYPGYRCPLVPLPINGGLFTGPNLRSPYIQSFNFSVQRQLTSSVMVESTYAGKIGIKLEALRTFNPARFINSPLDGSAPSAQNVNDRVLSHCLQNAETLANRNSQGANYYQNPYNRNADYGPCDADLRHNFVTSVVYESPKFANRGVNLLVGNWQLSFLTSAHTGFLFNPVTGVDASLTGVGQDLATRATIRSRDRDFSAWTAT